MHKLFLTIALCFIQVTNSFAQRINQLNSAEILLAMQKLNTLGSVLYIAAHPDDENTRLLAYLANERKYRTGYLSITRGDGGQNLIGKEQGELLGLIRTQELLAARRVDGAEQFFTRANDFGYSKNPEETFSIWNKDSILADVVYAIRKFKPDVIICRFPTTGEGGHGHHTASAILAVEAFDAAADPNKFPEQLQYVEIWQARRLFWNTFNFGSNNTTSPNQLKLDVGTFNPLLGKGYGEIAAESRSNHKSQGFGAARQRGANIEYFRLLKGDSVKSDLFEGIPTGWKKFKGTERIQKELDGCIKGFQANSPENSLNALIAIYKNIAGLDVKNSQLAYWKNVKLKETETLLLACSGLWLEASAADYIAIPGNDIAITAQIINRNKGEVKLNKMSFLNQTDTVTGISLKPNELHTFKHKEKLASNAPYSNPYWLNQDHGIGLYTVHNRLLVGVPENNPSTKVMFDISIQDLNLRIERDVVYKYTDPVKGEVYRSLEILPPITVNISDKVFVFTDNNPKTIQVRVKANTENVKGSLRIYPRKVGWRIVIDNPDYTLVNKGDEALIEAVVTRENGLDCQIYAIATVLNKVPKDSTQTAYGYTRGISRIEYDHIPYQFILSPANSELISIDLKKTNIKIAYIPGAGDDVPECLKQIGYDVTILTDELLESEDFSKYPAIITGIRAYNTNNNLQGLHKKLMAYVEDGGNLIVQYNTNSRVGPMAGQIGPYPFTISRERVTNENAEVRFKNDSLPVLNYPNKITSEDFNGWVQERGIYFATDIDKRYETVFSMNDPNEKANEGSLIIGKHGKGNFVYTGLAFFRELPAGVPGAYRLFVNILSLPDNE